MHQFCGCESLWRMWLWWMLDETCAYRFTAKFTLSCRIWQSPKLFGRSNFIVCSSRSSDTRINFRNMKRRRLMIALLTLSFITSVTTIVALMITAVHLATGPTPNPTTTVSTGDTETSTTSTTLHVQSSTTTTAQLTTTINLDELLCDDWLCNWKGRFRYEHIYVIIITLVKLC